MEKRKCGEIWNNRNRIDMQSILIDDKTIPNPSLYIRTPPPPPSPLLEESWKLHNFVKDVGSSNYVKSRHHLCYLKNRNQYVK